MEHPPREPYDASDGQETDALAPFRQVQAAAQAVKGELQKVIVGQEALMELLLAALFCGGHVLLEGVPGIAKTLVVKLLARTLDVGFARIQFTPDLMPSDVVGTTVFNLKTSEFTFNPGPIFSNLILIDEINRAPAKTQAALFEVMEEAQVTVDGKTYPMAQPFFVVATQNPLEQEGTYQLPEAQLDRFLFRILLNYPELEEEKAILNRFQHDFGAEVASEVQPVLDAQQVEAFRKIIQQVHLEPELLDFIAELVIATRNHPSLYLGASPRASLAIMKTAKALAALEGRNYATPDDLKRVAFPVLNHRLILHPEREMEGLEVRQVIEELLQSREVPR